MHNNYGLHGGKSQAILILTTEGHRPETQRGPVCVLTRTGRRRKTEPKNQTSALGTVPVVASILQSVDLQKK